MKKFLILGVLIASYSVANAESFHINAAKEKINSICIINNPKVTVDGFVDETTSVLEKQGVKVYNGESKDCQANLEYVADMHWMGVKHLSKVDYKLSDAKTKETLATAEYDCGNFSLDKYHAKVDVVVPELIAKLLPQNK